MQSPYNDKMDIKIDKIQQDKNFFSEPLRVPSEGNFFASQPENFASENKNHSASNRLNDFDSNILENNAYQDISDEMLKIEHKIGLLENSLAKITGEIEVLQSLGKSTQIPELISRKSALEKEIADLNEKYSELGLSAKISGQIASVVNFTSNKKINSFTKAKDFMAKKVLAKISKKFNYSQKMQEALEKLSNINANVDELITMQTPYGEKIGRYEMLTAYLNRANTIHAQISQNLEKNENIPQKPTLKSKMI